MNRTKGPGRGTRRALQIESQDDIAFITGRHSAEDEEKQIKTPMPRKSGERQESKNIDKRDGGR